MFVQNAPMQPLSTPGPLSVGVIGLGYWGPNLLRVLADNAPWT